MSIIWPNGTTTKPRVTSRYGPRVHPKTGKFQSLHRGVDLAGPRGRPQDWTNIVSPVAGTVTRNENQPSGAGNWVEIREDATGDRFRFFHLKSRSGLAVRARVSQGSFIGVMGETGTATDVHLHLEVWPGGAGSTDPEPYFARRVAPLPPAPKPPNPTTEGDDDMRVVRWNNTAEIFIFGPQQVALANSLYGANVVDSLTTGALGDAFPSGFVEARDKELTAICVAFGVPWHAIDAVRAGTAYTLEGKPGTPERPGNFWSRELELAVTLPKLETMPGPNA